MIHGSLFSGIGGFDLGFQRAGIETAWQVEINSYCRRVLERHFPNAVRFEDIRTVGSHNLPKVDILSGGFPCQDISNAGKRAGIDGERSGLWSEYARIIRELRPKYVVVENVSALLVRGIERVLGDLATCGYDAEWNCIRASDVGAPHRRERVWIVAYADSGRYFHGQTSIFAAKRGLNAFRKFIASGKDVANAKCNRSAKWMAGSIRWKEGNTRIPFNSGKPRTWTQDIGTVDWWATEPNVGRVANGVSSRVDRLKGLGNAIIPQIAEYIGRSIIEAEKSLIPQ
jgi:DNA (cytosine-5)-methyltransferase 1